MNNMTFTKEEFDRVCGSAFWVDQMLELQQQVL